MISGRSRFNTASGKHCCNEVVYLDGYIKTSEQSFNTASGKHCCNIKEDALCARKVASFNTASGKHCCNSNALQNLRHASFVGVSIPQAVSTVATRSNQLLLCDKELGVSIPQAVSTVATFGTVHFGLCAEYSFNTASGKHCCNIYVFFGRRYP